LIQVLMPRGLPFALTEAAAAVALYLVMAVSLNSL
jgi:hypothetical protein